MVFIFGSSQLQDLDLDSKSLEVKTVDGYQGREKEAHPGLTGMSQGS